MIKPRLILALLLLLPAGCSGIFNPAGTLEAPKTPAPTATLVPTPEDTPTSPGVVTLEIWLPPQFAPVDGSPSGELLKKRLNDFTARRGDLRLQVRIKALDGPGGLLDSLTTASAAAPLSLPDLIALPRPMLETAALKGLLHPFDDLIDNPEDPDWYDYAQRLARLQDSLFGLPFAGDALVLIYRRTAVPQPPATLADVVQTKYLLAFPAADPQALFTLALYQAAGGKILDAEGRPILEKDPLTRVLAFYDQAAQAELAPFLLTQFQSDDQSWDAFQKGQADMVVTWASRYLHGQPEDSAVAPIPTPDGKYFTLATGWVWALASPHLEDQKLTAELAIYLSESAFVGDWTEAIGYLPPRPSALEGWRDASLRSFARQISQSASLVPSADVLPSLATPLVGAVAEMLKLQSDPDTAAQEAVNSLLSP